MDTDQSRRNPRQANKEINKAKFLGSPKMKDYVLHRRKKNSILLESPPILKKDSQNSFPIEGRDKINPNKWHKWKENWGRDLNYHY